jgi:pyruvate/2-oxoglutarate dehydrogenase complex dihydrolipoamide dehydrogenase (E3) component
MTSSCSAAALPASTALRRWLCTACGSLSSSASWSAASALTGLALPSKSLLRPGEAVQVARQAAATAEVDVQGALAWRDLMVSNHSDAGQERWLGDRGIDLLRGTGRLAGTGTVEVDGARHTAEHMVVVTRSDPIVPPVPGLRELEGVWELARRRA